jgi:hypothetical protein
VATAITITELVIDVNKDSFIEWIIAGWLKATTKESAVIEVRQAPKSVISMAQYTISGIESTYAKLFWLSADVILVLIS